MCFLIQNIHNNAWTRTIPPKPSTKNPPPDPSQLDDALLQWSVKLDTKNFLSPEELKSVQLFRRAADYIAAGMRV
ncbi:hypothetical protein D9758_003951 [Tetrapyrgos nigripes]|uniref:Uncharacterized protein n=1 Tax=Tetrapyrgos nigripes TaxID=182062 RepID=A0A8H5GL98_9AGAR|nr:hypothetical protein D9758_003951 [Tetrapyrgos nigripes]